MQAPLGQSFFFSMVGWMVGWLNLSSYRRFIVSHLKNYQLNVIQLLMEKRTVKYISRMKPMQILRSQCFILSRQLLQQLRSVPLLICHRKVEQLTEIDILVIIYHQIYTVVNIHRIIRLSRVGKPIFRFSCIYI